VRGRYDMSLDREAAYEMLTKRAEAAAAAAPPPSREEAPRRASNRMSVAEVVMREVGRTLGREIVRGILGSIFKRR